MAFVSNVRDTTQRGAEKLSGLWRASLGGKVAVVLSAVLVALLVFSVISALAAPASRPSLAPQQISGVFADVNGDGLTDYIVNAEVIVNKGPLGP